MLMNTRILRWREVAPIVGVSRMTIDRMEKAGTFPQRIRIGNGSVGWLEHEVEAWLAQRMWRVRNDQYEIGGFAHRSDLRQGYEAGGGTWSDERFHWWKVYRCVWWGLGLARQGRQHLDGTFRSVIMAASGRRVAELEWDALCLIETT